MGNKGPAQRQLPAQHIDLSTPRDSTKEFGVDDNKSLCRWCGIMASPKHLDQCRLRPVRCPHCDQVLSLVALEPHQKTCPKRPGVTQDESSRRIHSTQTRVMGNSPPKSAIPLSKSFAAPLPTSCALGTAAPYGNLQMASGTAHLQQPRILPFTASSAVGSEFEVPSSEDLRLQVMEE